MSTPNRCFAALSGLLALAILMAGCGLTTVKEEGLAFEIAPPPVPASLEWVHPVFPHSIVPGGVHSVLELRGAAGADPVVREHYKDVDVERLERVKLTQAVQAHVSFRVKDQIYWTRDKIVLNAGEELLSDGAHHVRTRCGNLVSETPRQPVLPDKQLEPKAMDFVTPIPAEPTQPRNDLLRDVAAVATPLTPPAQVAENNKEASAAAIIPSARESGFINSSGGFVGGFVGGGGGGGGGGGSAGGGGSNSTGLIAGGSNSANTTVVISNFVLSGGGTNTFGLWTGPGGGSNTTVTNWNSVINNGATFQLPSWTTVTVLPPPSVFIGWSATASYVSNWNYYTPINQTWTSSSNGGGNGSGNGGGGGGGGGSPQPQPTPAPPPPTPTPEPTPPRPQMNTPEPSTLLLLIGAGLVLAGAASRNRR